MLVSPFFPMRALSPLPLHLHGPRRKPLSDQCLSHVRKNHVTATEGNTSPRRYPRLAAIQHVGIPSPTTRGTTPPNRSSHALRMPRPYPLRPKHNPRIAAMEGIATQFPRRHPAHRTTIGPHPIASAWPPPSHSSHSTHQPRPDLVMLEYFPFYAPAPPRSCDAQV
jgi:hypothetical protein